MEFIMNWTKELAEELLKLVDARATADTNLEIADAAVQAFLKEHSLGIDETQAARDAFLYKQGFVDGQATPPEPTPAPAPSEPTPVPAPAPAPDPVVVPMSVGPTPSVVQNMKLIDGVYVSQPGWESTVAAVHFKVPYMIYGAILKVEFDRFQKYPWGGNIKVFRVWKDGMGYPNFYAGLQADGSMILYTEKLTPVTGLTRFYFKYPPPQGTWRHEVWEWQANSGLGKNDGWIKITVGDQVILNKTGWQTDDVFYTGVPSLVIIQDDISNGSLPADSVVQYKNIEISAR